MIVLSFRSERQGLSVVTQDRLEWRKFNIWRKKKKKIERQRGRKDRWMEERGTYTRILFVTFTASSQRLQRVKLRVLNPENLMVLKFSTDK